MFRSALNKSHYCVRLNKVAQATRAVSQTVRLTSTFKNVTKASSLFVSRNQYDFAIYVVLL